MVATVATEVRDVVPVISTGVGAKVTVGGLVAPEGPLTVAVRATLPVKLPVGATVIVEVFPVAWPWVRVRDAGAGVRVKLPVGVELTVTAA